MLLILDTEISVDISPKMSIVEAPPTTDNINILNGTVDKTVENIIENGDLITANIDCKKNGDIVDSNNEIENNDSDITEDLCLDNNSKNAEIDAEDVLIDKETVEDNSLPKDVDVEGESSSNNTDHQEDIPVENICNGKSNEDVQDHELDNNAVNIAESNLDDSVVKDTEVVQNALDKEEKAVPVSSPEKGDPEDIDIAQASEETSKETELTNKVDDTEELGSSFEDVLNPKSPADTTLSNALNNIIQTLSSEDEVNESSKAINENTPNNIITTGLSNNLDIISDDEEPQVDKITSTSDKQEATKHCVTVEDDDDIMLIDEESGTKDSSNTPSEPEVDKILASPIIAAEETTTDEIALPVEDIDKGSVEVPLIEKTDITEEEEKTDNDMNVEKTVDEKPLVPFNFIKSFKTKICDMTRDDLEEFCLLKIVEGIVDRSNLSEIKTKLKTMTQYVDEWSKKFMVLSKQNRDLQIVLKTVQEEQKKKSNETISPLRITRSVGMQVLMTDCKLMDSRGPARGRKPGNKDSKPTSSPKTALKANLPSAVPIPVPRLVPAQSVNSPSKLGPRTSPQLQNSTVTSNSGVAKINSPAPNGLRTSPPVQTKPNEKRPYSSIQSIDLTDDEPPQKQMAAAKGPQPPVRLVPSQQLMPQSPRSPFAPNIMQQNNPRKVYIPISSPQQNNVRPGQTVMFKQITPSNIRPRPTNALGMRMPHNANTMRVLHRSGSNKHPAPLPHAFKQQQPPNWKALPPAPDLKISKVENGIVISWKMEGYQEDSYEEIASYQLYAYQETTSPPNTLLWKKIGDVKALPLPMACTLTQFMAGFKYFFAVRAVDVKSRIGPFSLPGSILLLNK